MPLFNDVTNDVPVMSIPSVFLLEVPYKWVPNFYFIRDSRRSTKKRTHFTLSPTV